MITQEQVKKTVRNNTTLGGNPQDQETHSNAKRDVEVSRREHFNVGYMGKH